MGVFKKWSCLWFCVYSFYGHVLIAKGYDLDNGIQHGHSVETKSYGFSLHDHSTCVGVDEKHHLILDRCMGGCAQNWALADDDSIRHGPLCLSVAAPSSVVLDHCRSKPNQQWLWDIKTQKISTSNAKQCLHILGKQLILIPCMTPHISRWIFFEFGKYD